LKVAVRVNFRDHAGKAPGDGIGGIDHRQRVGIRDIERIKGRQIAHKADNPAIG
jgi:hypothetical protein